MPRGGRFDVRAVRPVRLPPDSRGGETDPDVSLGVGRLSQLAVGYCDASAMAAADHLDAPPEAVERLDALFPAGSVWLREGF